METIKFADDIKVKSIADIVYYSCSKDTFDEKGYQQCEAFKNRSIDDLIIIFNSYGYNFDLQRVEDIMFTVGFSDERDDDGNWFGPELTYFPCPDIFRDVFQVNNWRIFTHDYVKKQLKDYEI